MTLQTEWGQPSLTVATQQLLTAALDEPANQHFVLLDETAVPLYPAPATYLLLIGETRSRMRACEVRTLCRKPYSCADHLLWGLDVWSMIMKGWLIRLSLASSACSPGNHGTVSCFGGPYLAFGGPPWTCR